jgi:hypothetical protein
MFGINDMNPQEVKVGTHKVGPFQISVQRQPFTNKMIHDYFEVFVCEEFGAGLYYTDLVKDERFNVFGHLTEADKKTDVEYLHHAQSVAMKAAMPTLLLSRENIGKVFDMCQLSVDLVEVSPHTLDYCLTCRTYMVLCANCGNNCCNGGTAGMMGDPKCSDDCHDAYRVQDAYWADNKSVTFTGQRVGPCW